MQKSRDIYEPKRPHLHSVTGVNLETVHEFKTEETTWCVRGRVHTRKVDQVSKYHSKGALRVRIADKVERAESVNNWNACTYERAANDAKVREFKLARADQQREDRRAKRAK